MTTDTQYLDKFLADVEDMLKKQKNYFATRNFSALTEAKDAEKHVRAEIVRIRNERTQKQVLTLWGDGK
jgi:hypothetical protein